jgi:hypothetical protein
MNQESSTTAHGFRGPALRGVRVVLSCAALWFAWVAPARAQGESPADSAAVSAPATASSPAPADTAATSEADAPNARMLVSNKRVELVGSRQRVRDRRHVSAWPHVHGHRAARGLVWHPALRYRDRLGERGVVQGVG